jgi:hypothetical protein
MLYEPNKRDLGCLRKTHTEGPNNLASEWVTDSNLQEKKVSYDNMADKLSDMEVPLTMQ